MIGTSHRNVSKKTCLRILWNASSSRVKLPRSTPRITRIIVKTPFYKHSTHIVRRVAFPPIVRLLSCFSFFQKKNGEKSFSLPKIRRLAMFGDQTPAQVGAESESKQSERRCELRPLPRDKAMLRLALGDDLR